MRVFLTGATGYIGGSVGHALMAAGHEVYGLARSAHSLTEINTRGMIPVPGALDDADVLADAAGMADAVIHTADADHLGSVQSLLAALEGSGKRLIHTSGSSIVGTQAMGERIETAYDERAEFAPSPARVARVALNAEVMTGSDRGLHPVIIAPALIYGLGLGAGPHSMQIPWLIESARKHGMARHLGPGENVWSNVHIEDLVDLYLLALERAPAGAFYWAENGENSMRELCVAIGRTMGLGEETSPLTADEAAAEWGEGPALNTMGSNSRVIAFRARDELGWAPSRPTALHEIEHGCYAGGNLA